MRRALRKRRVCSVPPSHSTHKQSLQLLYFCTFLFYLYLTHTTFIQRILIHARTFFHFRLAQAPERSTWLFLSLHRLPAFLLVATSLSYLSSVVIKYFLRWSLFHHVVAIIGDPESRRRHKFWLRSQLPLNLFKQSIGWISFVFFRKWKNNLRAVHDFIAFLSWRLRGLQPGIFNP